MVISLPYQGDDTSASKKQGRDSGLSSVLLSPSLDPNDQKSLEGMQKMEKEESPTDATQEEDVDDMEGSGEEGDLEGSDSEAAQWADQEQWFGMQWGRQQLRGHTGLPCSEHFRGLKEPVGACSLGGQWFSMWLQQGSLPLTPYF